MAEQDKDVKALKPRLRQILDLLPKHEWVISRAAMECGYARSYAQKRLPKRLMEDPAFVAAMDAKRREFMQATGWDEDKWRQEAVAQYERAKAEKDWPATVQILKMLGMNAGAFERDNEQRRQNFGMIIM